MSGDAGFLSGDAAAADAREIRAMLDQAGRELRALKIEALVYLIDQRIEVGRDRPPARSRGRIALAARYIHRRLGAAFKQYLGRDDVAEQQILERGHLVAELGKIVFGHPNSPQSIEQAQANAARLTAHRLSEGFK